jgi:dTDP-4-dehydrorhamnose reductase
MKRRLMVTGCGGFVAGSVIRNVGADWDVHALSRGGALLEREGLSWHSFDPLDTERLRSVFRQVEPHAVIHAAAIADIDYCEANKEVAGQVNVGLTEELARLCRQGRARMVYLSTDTVFDGEKGLYREEDPPGPLNYYAETKVRAENIVAGETKNSVVARLSLVMGLPMLGRGNSFLSRMISTFSEGREVGVPADEIRTPIDVITLGRALIELAANDFKGLIHLAGNDRLSRLAMVRRIAERLGYSTDLVVARDPSGIAGRAPRPRDVSLDNTKARATLVTPMRGLDDGLELVLAAKEGAAS